MRTIPNNAQAKKSPQFDSRSPAEGVRVDYVPRAKQHVSESVRKASRKAQTNHRGETIGVLKQHAMAGGQGLGMGSTARDADHARAAAPNVASVVHGGKLKGKRSRVKAKPRYRGMIHGTSKDVGTTLTNREVANTMRRATDIANDLWKVERHTAKCYGVNHRGERVRMYQKYRQSPERLRMHLISWLRDLLVKLSDMGKSHPVGRRVLALACGVSTKAA